MDNNHKKPTPEELDANIKKSVEEAEKLALNPEPNPDDVVPPVTPTPPAPTPDPVTPPETPTPPVVTSALPIAPDPDDEEEEKRKQKEQEEQDYKKRYVESTREAQILYAKNKKTNQAIETATALPEPTEEELKVEAVKQGVSFDDMTAFEKLMFKKNVHNDRRLNEIAKVSQEEKDIEAWHGKVDTFVDDPQTLLSHPDLEGKQDEFKIFAAKPTRRNAPFEDLVKSFLFDVEKAKPKHKGAMFPTGTGGPGAPPKPPSDKISLAEGAKLKDANYKEYIKLLKAGKIANE